MARKQCFLVCPPLENMARKQCFLVCPPLKNTAKKQCFLVCPPLGNMARKQCFLVRSLLGNMARKQCLFLLGKEVHTSRQNDFLLDRNASTCRKPSLSCLCILWQDVSTKTANFTCTKRFGRIPSAAKLPG